MNRLFAVLGSPMMQTLMSQRSVMPCFLLAAAKKNNKMPFLISSWPKMLGSKNAPCRRGARALSCFLHPPTLGFVQDWIVSCRLTVDVLDAATKEREHYRHINTKTFQAQHPMIELHLLGFLRFLHDRHVPSNGDPRGVRRQPASRQGCTSVPRVPSRPNHPAERRRWSVEASRLEFLSGTPCPSPSASR